MYSLLYLPSIDVLNRLMIMIVIVHVKQKWKADQLWIAPEKEEEQEEYSITPVFKYLNICHHVKRTKQNWPTHARSI